MNLNSLSLQRRKKPETDLTFADDYVAGGKGNRGGRGNDRVISPGELVYSRLLGTLGFEE